MNDRERNLKPHRVLIAADLWAEFTAPEPGRIACTWYPVTPAHLTRGQLRRYRRARDAFAAKLAPGGRVAVLEL